MDHLLNISYDATKKCDWKSVIAFIEHHTAAKLAGSGHFKNRGDIDFWCDETTGRQAIHLLDLYFDFSSYDVKIDLHPIIPKQVKYVSPFTGKLV